MDSDSDHADAIGIEDDDDDEDDTIISSFYVAKSSTHSKGNTRMLAKLDDSLSNKHAKGGISNLAFSKATQGPSCRCVLFSRSPHDTNSTISTNVAVINSNDSTPLSGGEYLFTACNGGSLRCLDSERACSLEYSRNAADSQSAPILWSIENAHSVGINKLYQLPHSSPCGPLVVTGDDAGAVRLWDARMCANSHGNIDKKNKNSTNNNAQKTNPFDNLMKPPQGCVMHWKVNHDYISDFEANNDGTTLFASSADGTLSVFDLRFVQRKGTPRSIEVPSENIDHTSLQRQPQQTNNANNKNSTWETSGYTQSDNQEDELLSLTLLKHSQKLLCGSQQGILSIFSYNIWCDISDRFPGHPYSIDALLKIDEDTVLTGSSDGLVRAVQLLPNSFLGVLGGHDGYPVEGLGWSAGRKMVGSVSHDEYIRLWDASFLNENDVDYGGDEEEEDKMHEEEGSGNMEGRASAKQGLRISTRTTTNNSDEEWEDMDDDDEKMTDGNGDDDDSDSDESDEGDGDKPKKRERIFKTANEEFFQDL